MKKYTIKPLEWKKFIDRYKSATVFGDIWIVEEGDYSFRVWVPKHGRLSLHKSEKLAKARAQSWYETKLLAALEVVR